MNCAKAWNLNRWCDSEDGGKGEKGSAIGSLHPNRLRHFILSICLIVMGVTGTAIPSPAAYIDPVNSPKITGLYGSGVSQFLGLSNGNIAMLRNSNTTPLVRVVNTSGTQVYETTLGPGAGTPLGTRSYMSLQMYAIASGEIIVVVSGNADNGCDGSNADYVSFLRLSATGVITTSLTPVSSRNYCHNSMVELSNGNLAFSYYTGDSSSNYSDDLRIMQPSGAAVTSETSIQKTGSGGCITGAVTRNDGATLAANHNGSFLTTYSCNDTAYNLYGILYNNNGTQVTVGSVQHFSLGTYDSDYGMAGPNIMGLTDNNFMVAYRSASGTYQFKKITPTGTVTNPGSYSDAYPNFTPTFKALGDGGFVAFDNTPSNDATYTYTTAFGVRYDNSAAVVQSATNLDNAYWNRCDADDNCSNFEVGFVPAGVSGAYSTGYAKGILFINGRTGDLWMHGFAAVNTAPTFVGSTTTLTVNQNSGATDIRSLLHVSDSDPGQTETWTQSSAPSHGILTISGATASSGTADITPGGTITYTPTAGYSGSDSFTIQVSDGTATATRTISVTVNPTYTVTYNGNGNTSGSVPTDGNSYLNGATVTVLGNTGSLVRTGYTFAGWNTLANGSGTDYAATGSATFTMGAANVTLYAKWTINSYTVTYDGNGNTGGTVPVDGSSHNYNSIVTVLGNTGSLVRSGYSFVGWNTAADGNGTDYAATGSATFTMDAANVTLYAKWAINHTLTVNFAGDGGNKVDSTSPDHGINCDKGSPGSGCNASYVTGTPVTLQATADWKSTFVGWSDNAPAGVVTMDGDKTVTATFDANFKAKLIPGGALFASIQDAYASVPSGSMTIQAQAWSFLEDLLFANATSVTLTGGMDASYNPTTGYSTVKSLTVGTGSAVIGNISIK